MAKITNEFQLTHSRGVRRQKWGCCYEVNDFNSRTHVECDVEIQAQQPRTFYFNSRTHVECDIFGMIWKRGQNAFQLTHSRGVRLVEARPNVPGQIFQLTHSRGVRRRFANKQTGERDFNSRTHVECDQPKIKKSRWLAISTHALTWSATKQNRFRHQKQRISTHALTWSATKLHYATMIQYWISTHALTWSATGIAPTTPAIKTISTHALTWSATKQSPKL